jgi:hypothetical protein
MTMGLLPKGIGQVSPMTHWPAKGWAAVVAFPPTIYAFPLCRKEEPVEQFTDCLTDLIHVVFGFSSYDIEQPRASAIRFRVCTVMFSIAPHSMRDTTDWVVFIRAAKSCWLMFNSIRRFTACSIRAYNGARES